MQPPIFKVCAADLTVQGLLGDPVRFVFGIAPQDIKYPYAVWQVITGSPENYLAGRPDVDGYTLQVDVYAKSDTDTSAVAGALRAAIEPYAYIVRLGGQSKEPDTESGTDTYRISFDVDWLHQR